jgi:hypothetical protein
MIDLPVPQNYYLITSESVGSDEPVGMIWDEGVVRAVPGKKTMVSCNGLLRLLNAHAVASGLYSASIRKRGIAS